MEREFVNVKKLKNLHTLSTIEERREWENIMEKYLTRCGEIFVGFIILYTFLLYLNSHLDSCVSKWDTSIFKV